MHHIVIFANETSSIYNFRRELLHRLTEEGYKVTIVAEALSTKAEIEKIGCHVIDTKTANHGTSVLQDMRLFSTYFKILHKYQPDIVLTYSIKPNVYAGLACRFLHIPRLSNVTGLGKPVEYPGPMQTLTTHLYKIGVANAEVVFFQNSDNKQFFVQRKLLSTRTKAILLPGSGVDLKRFPALPYPDEESIHFLFTARIMKEKGIDLYLAAAKRIKSVFPNTVFHVCGSCDDEKYIQILKQAEADGYIIYYGEQKDMVSFYKRMHCIVQPSYYPEGMSNVLLEAAACARPIITTNRGGCREAVNDGKTGFLIPIKDEDALVDALERFLALSPEQQEDMGLAGRKKMEAEFDREIVVRKYLDEIRECIPTTQPNKIEI